ncbi:MAG: cobalamin-dependent protein [Candidatus Omnitrophica bacterium]|nr:cobalamin-dependent protein [Candidatus Omnitrophota bacterium]
MKVALINPPLIKSINRKLGPIAENLFYNSAPLGLCYLGSCLEEKGHEVTIIDAAVQALSTEKILTRLKSFRPEAIGITVLTVSSYSAYSMAGEIKKALPDIKIIAGGPHITSNPEELANHTEIDIGVMGEGEFTLSELLDSIKEVRGLEDVNGLVYRKDDRLFFTPQREFIKNLDVLPYPARHLVPIELYRPQPNDQRELPKLSMITSRGCPYPCIFCDKNVFKDRYRSFSPAYIVKEMKHLVDDYRVRDIAFVDSTFTPNRKRVIEIVDEIKASGLDVTWTCSIRANILDKELLKKMKDSGCWRVRIGIESGNEEVLRFIKKGITKEEVRRVSDWAYELDLEPKGFFMIGHLTDTKETIDETIKFACSLPLKDITVQVNTPLTNTPQKRLAEKYGDTMELNDLSNYSFFEPVFIPRGLTKKEMLDYYRRFYMRFYLRPITWLRHLKKIRRLSDLAKYMEGIKILIFMSISWIKEKLS